MIWLWILNIILWVAFAKYNYYLIFKEKDFHKSGAWTSFFIVALSSVMIVFGPESRYIWNNEFLFSFTLDLSIPVYIFIMLTIRWTVFDLAMNYYMSKPWWYYGNMSKGYYNAKPYFKNGTMDRKFKIWQFPIKFVFLIVSITLSV